MKLFIVCVVIKIVITVGTSNEVKLNDTNREGSGIKRFTYFKHNYTNINHSGNRARYVYETNKVGHNVKENSNIKKLFKINGNSKNNTRVKYIKIVRYVPVRVEVTGREAKDQNIAEINLDDYNTSKLNNQKEVHINDKFMKAKSADALSNLIAKYLISKNGKENQRLVQRGKEIYKLDLREFIQYLQSLGFKESEISKYEELLQRNAMGFQGTLNQQHNSLTRKQNEYQNVIPLNDGVTGVKEVGIVNDDNSDATRISEVPPNVKLGDKEVERDTPQEKLNDDFNLELKNVGKTQVMEVPINGNIITMQQKENPKLLFDVVSENQVILPNNTNAVAQQQNLEAIDVKENQLSNLLKAKELNGTKDLTEPKSQLVDDKETLLQGDEKNKLPDIETNGNVTDIDFYDYQEKMESDAMNKHNKSHNDNLMNTTDKYTNVSLEVGVNLPNKGPESLEIIKLPYTTLKDGLLDTETNNPLKELYNQYVKTGNVDVDDLPSEKPNLTSIFDVQFSGKNLVADNEGRNTEIKTETSNLVGNTKVEHLNSGLGEITQLRKVLSAILIALESIFKQLSLFGKQPKLLKLMEILTGQTDDNHINLNGLQNLMNLIRVLQHKWLDFDSVFTKHHFRDSLITREEEINEVLTNAVKVLMNNGVSNYELKRIVQESLLSVITGISINRVKECEEKVWNEVRDALYRSMLGFTVNSK